MSRIKYNASIDTFQELWDGISEAELTVTRDRGDKVTVEDASGNELEFSGTTLDWTDAGLVGGTVREISLSNTDGKELFEIKTVGLEAAAVQAAFDTDGLDGVLAAVLTGDDRIKGSKGDDWLIGLAGGLLTLATGVVVHFLTLPTELDASFGRALPLLKRHGVIRAEDMPRARRLLTAAAFTYVAVALQSLLNIARWWAILRR